jgi:hypothetical protein
MILLMTGVNGIDISAAVTDLQSVLFTLAGN